MPQKYRPGQVSVGPFWVDEAMRDTWRAFAEERGSDLRAEVIVAMARHMANPPPLPPRPEEVPLPPPKRGRPKKKSGK